MCYARYYELNNKRHCVDFYIFQIYIFLVYDELHDL